MDTITVAAVNWKIRPAESFESFSNHLVEVVSESVRLRAEFVVLPENVTIELLGSRDISESAVPEFIAAHADEFSRLCSESARRHQVWLVAGSSLIADEDGSFANVCEVFDPNGNRLIRQRKVKLTRYEREVWRLAFGRGLGTPGEFPIGVTICYDCEFPESGRILAERGVLLQCVPAFTETMHGFHRVRHSCHARAIENQVYVIHSSLVGSLGREPVPNAVGSSAIIAPSVGPFPANGILAGTQMNEEAIAIAKLDFGQLVRTRESGDVRNWQDRDARAWESD